MKPKSTAALTALTLRFGSRQSAFLFATALAGLLYSQQAKGASIYWDGTASPGTWATAANWSTAAGAATPNPAAAPGVADTAIFNITGVSAAQTVNLGANQIVQGISVIAGATGGLTIGTDATNRTLTIGSAGIAVANGAGVVTIGSTTTGQNVAINVTQSQVWSNTSAANSVVIANTVTRNANATINFTGAGTFTAANAFSNTNGIVGPWAFSGSSTSTRYATKNGSNAIVALTGTAAATAADFTDTTGAVNYDLAASTGATPTTFSGNTIRYTGAADTLSLGATSFALNGLLNAGTGLLTVSSNTLTIGSTNEFVVNSATTAGAITISSVIQNGASAGALTKTGTGNLTLTGANTYTGGTFLTQGNLFLNNPTGNALQGDVTLAGGSRLVLGASNQIADASVINFSPGNNTVRFQLAGFNETVGGIRDTVTATATNYAGNIRIIESATDGVSNSPATLTINTATGQTYSFAGLVRSAPGAGVTNSALTIIKDGAGTQEFAGTGITYTGTTTINAGVLRLTASAVNGSAITLAGGSVEYAATAALVRSGLITSTSSTGGFIKSGASAVTLSGANTYQGPTTVNAGTLTAGIASVADTNGAFGLNSAVTVANVAAAILDLNSFNTQIGSLAGGGTTGGNVTLGSATLTTGGNNATTTSYGGVISGTGGVTKIGTGVQLLTSPSSYTGATSITGGTLGFARSNAGALSATSGVTVASGSTLQLRGVTSAAVSLAAPLALTGSGAGGSFSLEFPAGNTQTFNLDGTIAINNGAVIRHFGLINTYNYNGVISGDASTSGLTFRTEGNNTIGQPHTVVLGAAATYTGNTTLAAVSQQGILRLGLDNALPTTTSLQLTGGGNANTSASLELNGKNQSLAGLTSTPNTGGARVINSSATASTLTISNPATVTYSGVLGGTSANNFGLTKSNTGTFILSGVNTYTGATQVDAGTLRIGTAGSLDNTAVTIGGANATGTPTLAGGGTIGGATVIAAAGGGAVGTHSPGVAGVSDGVGTQTFSSTLNYGTGSIFEWNLSTAAVDPGAATADSGSYDKVVSTGAITGGSAIYKVVLSGTSTFTDAFWDTDKSWTNIFSGAGTPANLAAVFSSFSATGGLDSSGTVASRGQFTFNGSTSTLNWSAVPEPSSALVGLLVGAGLLRRRRA